MEKESKTETMRVKGRKLASEKGTKKVRQKERKMEGKCLTVGGKRERQKVWQKER